jgi:hypothetical protein
MKKKALILISLISLTIMAIPCIPTVYAKITEVNEGIGYTEYYGTMGRANFYVLIPDEWTNALGDGMLVMMCRPAAYQEDPRNNMPDYPFATTMAMQGIAVAASNYGENGGVKDGVIRMHQLTMFVIDNYEVTGKVFLFGTSLGGAVALLLGEKHPDIYSGVLETSGVKDYAAMYNDAVSYSGSDPFLILWTQISIPNYLDTYGGTPAERPKKYAKYSPINHADMAIPVISVIHAEDVIVKPIQTELYHAALSDPSLHQIVTVTEVTPGEFPYPGATGWYGHFDPATFAVAATNLFTLIAWSNTL